MTERAATGRGPSAVAVLVALALLLAVAVAWWWTSRAPAPGPEAPAPPPPQAPSQVRPAAQTPAPPPAGPAPPPAAPQPATPPPAAPAAPVEPLPPLEDSDQALLEAARPLVAPEQDRARAATLDDLLVPVSLVRHFVVTVDNLTQSRIPVRYRFLRPPLGLFLAREIGDGRYLIDPANSRRYEAFVSLIEGVDLDAAVALYHRYYPLLQAAWEQLGYPDRQFHDRLLEVIDHLLTGPVVEGPVELVRPKVLYQYADPGLEALSSGRKLMIRMGPDNARRVRAVLRRLRARLAVARPPVPAQ